MKRVIKNQMKKILKKELKALHKKGVIITPEIKENLKKAIISSIEYSNFLAEIDEDNFLRGGNNV